MKNTFYFDNKNPPFQKTLQSTVSQPHQPTMQQPIKQNQIPIAQPQYPPFQQFVKPQNPITQSIFQPNPQQRLNLPPQQQQILPQNISQQMFQFNQPRPSLPINSLQKFPQTQLQQLIKPPTTFLPPQQTIVSNQNLHDRQCLLLTGFNQNEINYINQSQLNITLQDALKQVTQSGAVDPLCALIDNLSSVLEQQSVQSCHGIRVNVDNDVRIVVGPVVGTVSKNNANILIEVQGPQKDLNIECYVLNTDGSLVEGYPIVEQFTSKRPDNFDLINLKPDTYYKVVFGGVNINDARQSFAEFKTLPEQINQLNILAISCNRFDRILLGQSNPFKKLVSKINNYDIALHLGDQVYAVGDQIDDIKELFQDYDKVSPEEQQIIYARGQDMFRQIYRNNWNKPYVKEFLSKIPNIMIWSDNDVANDFTTLKNQKTGEQEYSKNFLSCGIQVYREYQRQLWDGDNANIYEESQEQIEEWHSHIYGQVGIFMIDMRGNRVTKDGVQQDNQDIMSEKQWRELYNFISNPNIKVLIICAEIPFVGDSPEDAKKKAQNPKFDFLRDHWPYQDQELTRFLDLVFTFKAQGGGRDVILIGGDIHCGVYSKIFDNQTGLEIQHFTTSPITNHVVKFYPNLTGTINERYSYIHEPLGAGLRNYLELTIQLEPYISITGGLVPILEEKQNFNEFCEKKKVIY